MASADVPGAPAAQQPRWEAWFDAWGDSLRCCTAESVTASMGARASEAVEEPQAYGRKGMFPEDVVSPTRSTIAWTAAASPLSEFAKDGSDVMPILLGLARTHSKDTVVSPSRQGEGSASHRGRLAIAMAEARPVVESMRAKPCVRTPSFEVDYSELPELRIPEEEQPLVGGHLDVSFADMAATIFRDEDSPFSTFLCSVMGCFDMCASPFVEEAPGRADTTVQRSIYQLPLPADIPEVVACVLGLGKSMKSATFTRASSGPGVITLQQLSHTEGLLYSERMRVLNVHCLEEDPAGGVSWRTFTRIVWTKPLPWTHSFIAKFIESRVKAETKINAPELMRCIKEAAGAASPQR